jgi:hypothetical protein
MMTADLLLPKFSAFELDILRHVGGEKVDSLTWGAGMSVAVEWLEGRGLLCRERTAKGVRYALTNAGREVILAT